VGIDGYPALGNREGRDLASGSIYISVIPRDKWLAVAENSASV
jgi:hypothetical protein